MIHYVEYFELHNVSISLHLVHLSLSLLLYLSLSLTIHLSSSFLFLLAHLRVPCKANNQTSLSKNTMVPHVMFLINPVFWNSDSPGISFIQTWVFTLKQ